MSCSLFSDSYTQFTTILHDSQNNQVYYAVSQKTFQFVLQGNAETLYG